MWLHSDSKLKMIETHSVKDDISLFLGCLACSVVAITGLIHFLDAGLIKLGDRSSNHFRGWDFFNLVGITVWMYASPLAVFLLMTLVFRSYKSPTDERRRNFWIISVFIMTIAIVVLSLHSMSAEQLLSCAYVWCYNKDPTVYPNAFLQNMGSIIFFVALVFMLVLSDLLWKSVFAMKNLPKIETYRTVPDFHSWKRFAAISALLLGLPLMIVITGVLPPSYEQMTRSGIGRNAYTYISPHEAEIATAWMGTISWRWGPTFVVKLWPDTLVFYVYLEIVVLVSSLSASFSRVENMLSRKVSRWSLGHILLSLWSVICLFLFTYYWGHDHLYHFSKFNKYPMEMVARASGVVACMLMGLCLIPASKHSPFLTAAGLSWEGTVWMHILLGVLCSVAAGVHVIGYFIRFLQLGVASTILPLNAWFEYPSTDNWTVPMMAAVFWPAVLCYGIFPWMRRSNYEIFRYSHNFGLVLVPATIWHGTHAWNYMVPGIAIWLADHAIRFIRSAEEVQVTELAAKICDCWTDPTPQCPSKPVPEKITKLAFSWPGQERIHSPGMYVHVNFPQISKSEWHPFSLSSSPLDTAATLHIKDMGGESFTAKLHEFAVSSDETLCKHMLMNIQGPYGPHLDLSKHESVLLVAGGIGITPMASVVRFLVQQAQNGQKGALCRLHLVWSARSASIFDVMEEELNVIHDATRELLFDMQVSLYCSTAKEEGTCSLGTILPGMARFQEILAKEISFGKCLVRACGPPPMVGACESAANTFGDSVAFEPWSFVL